MEEQDVAAKLQTLVYEPNKKHKPVPTPGRHGSICPRDVDGAALLLASDVFGRKRYATDGTSPYCAQQHDPYRNAWHGYPVDWDEVPAQLVGDWVAVGKVDRRTVRRAKRRRGR
jgi:hypothetical protein